MSDISNILEMRHISKSFPGVKALDDVDLIVEKGTVHGIMGENGAGKSTLMKILFGQYQPDSGEIYYNGGEVQFTSVKDAVDHRISMIYQELSPIKDLTIAENVFVGRYPKKHHLVDWDKMHRSCQEIFDKLGFDYDPQTKIRDLKTADIQMLEIIKAISFNAELVIMDEPSSSISQNEVEQLYDFIKALKAKGITIIIITHKIDEIFTISDKVTVLRDGKHIGTVPTSKLDRAGLIKMMDGPSHDVFKHAEKLETTNIRPPQITRFGAILETAIPISGTVLNVGELGNELIRLKAAKGA